MELQFDAAAAGRAETGCIRRRSRSHAVILGRRWYSADAFWRGFTVLLRHRSKAGSHDLARRSRSATYDRQPMVGHAWKWKMGLQRRILCPIRQLCTSFIARPRGFIRHRAQFPEDEVPTENRV